MYSTFIRNVADEIWCFKNNKISRLMKKTLLSHQRVPINLTWLRSTGARCKLSFLLRPPSTGSSFFQFRLWAGRFYVLCMKLAFFCHNCGTSLRKQKRNRNIYTGVARMCTCEGICSIKQSRWIKNYNLERYNLYSFTKRKREDTGY